jgi:2-polyprenyl-3-methyl-5-hydroxy-6-metoxy-1,4-benzoquinol methylase
MKKTRIAADDIQFSSLSFMDDGRVFRSSGKLYRAIPAEHCEAVNRLFTSGLIDALVKEDLFVPSWITDRTINGFELVVEHQIVDVVSYPREWSFSMLKDAALLVLKVNEVANEFGYQTKDCHGYNVLFAGEKPVYIDLGSFIPFRAKKVTLLSLDEFLRSYYYPIKIWASVGEIWGKKAVPRPTLMLETDDYLRCRWPLFRWAIANSAGKLVSKICQVTSRTDEQFYETKRRHPSWKGYLAERGRSLGMSFASIQRLRRNVQKTRRKASRTLWSGYHDSFTQQDGEIALTPRFQHIAEILISLNISSVLEIAGNQGVLSRALKRMNPGLRVTCTDADEVAIDKGYCASKRDGLGINWSVLNPFFSELATVEECPSRRFKADAVVALALSHHLVLTRGLRLEWALDLLAQYSRNYLLIEFMPLGLYVGKESPTPPAWYTQDWFQTVFEKRFNLINCTHLEENRVLFVGTNKVMDRN